MLTFDNTQIAFQIKSDRDLKRAYTLFKIIAYPILVKIGNPFIKIASALRLPIGWIIKPTAYRQFVGGEVLETCGPTVEKLFTAGVYSILDYSVEGKESEKSIKEALEETLRSIKNGGAHPHIPFAVFKPTAFGNNNALELLSKGSSIEKSIMEEGEKFRQRIGHLCSTAYEKDIPILIDAEDASYQNFIDSVVMEMMAKYNTKKAIVFNTYQMYRHDRISVLENDIKQAREKKFFLGAKFVRGAYMEKERERARKLKYEDPIHPDKERTDRDFNLSLKISIDNIDIVTIFNGTHNEESSLYLVELMKEKGLEPGDKRVWFSQLFGMSDHISFNLAAQGYNVAKYVPYGPVRYVLPYLMRRVEENTSVKGQTGRELSLIKKEITRRSTLQSK